MTPGWSRREALPAMGMQPPGFLRGLLTVVRFEVRLLLFHPAVYLFVPFVVLQAIGTTELAEGAFNTPLLLTPGSLAMGLLNTLTLSGQPAVVVLRRGCAGTRAEYASGADLLCGGPADVVDPVREDPGDGRAGSAHSAGDLGGLRRDVAGPGPSADGVGTVRTGVGPHAHPDVHRLVGGDRAAERRDAESIQRVRRRGRDPRRTRSIASSPDTSTGSETGTCGAWPGGATSVGWSWTAIAILWNRLLYLSVAVLLAYASVQLFGRQSFDAARIVCWFRQRPPSRARCCGPHRSCCHRC